MAPRTSRSGAVPGAQLPAAHTPGAHPAAHIAPRTSRRTSRLAQFPAEGACPAAPSPPNIPRRASAQRARSPPHASLALVSPRTSPAAHFPAARHPRSAEGPTIAAPAKPPRPRSTPRARHSSRAPCRSPHISPSRAVPPPRARPRREAPCPSRTLPPRGSPPGRFPPGPFPAARSLRPVSQSRDFPRPALSRPCGFPRVGARRRWGLLLVCAVGVHEGDDSFEVVEGGELDGDLALGLA